MGDIINFGIKGVGNSVRFGRRNGTLKFDNSANAFKFRNIADDDYAIAFVGDPTQADHAANKAYVDAQIEGLTIKDPVRVASNALTDADSSISGAASDVANISYNSTGDSGNGIITLTGVVLDGTSLALNDRVLIKDSTDQRANGIYYVQAQASDTTLYRTTDAISTDFRNGVFCIVNEGIVWGDTGWVCTNNGAITIGTTNITWAQFSQYKGTTASDGLTETGGALRVRTDGVITKIINDNVSVNSSTTVGEVLLSAGADGTSASYGSLNLGNANATTGALIQTRGGTNQTSYSEGDLLYADSNGDLQKLAISSGIENKVLASSSNLPVWLDSFAIKHNVVILSGTVQITDGTFIANIPAGARIFAVHIEIVAAYGQNSIINIGDSSDNGRILNNVGIYGDQVGMHHTFSVDYTYVAATVVNAYLENVAATSPTPTAKIKLEYVVE
jgi:hypothetical protein